MPCIFLGRGKKAVTNSLKIAEIRDSEGQREPALQLLEISLRATARGFESHPLRHMRHLPRKKPQDFLAAFTFSEGDTNELFGL